MSFNYFYYVIGNAMIIYSTGKRKTRLSKNSFRWHWKKYGVLELYTRMSQKNSDSRKEIVDKYLRMFKPLREQIGIDLVCFLCYDIIFIDEHYSLRERK